MDDCVDLFDPVLPDGRLDPMFLSLSRSAEHAATRRYISAAFARMGDPNGTFISNFQGPSFHARLFEIACFAYLEGAGLFVSRPFTAPDFMATIENVEIAIEVVTANPADGADRDIGAMNLENLPFERIVEKSAVEFPRRMNAALKKKARRAYHEEAHVAGRPIVIMAQPAFEPGANLYIDDALIPCLYGDAEERVGFFGREDARPISAVAYCNGFTVSKFWRLSSPDSFRTRVEAIREGVCLSGLSDEPCRPKHFRYEVGRPETPAEDWAEGLTLFLNPNATIPLPADVLPASCTIAMLRDGTLLKCIGEFHPQASTMLAWPRPPAKSRLER